MSLTYLSGDDIGRNKKKSPAQKQKQAARKENRHKKVEKVKGKVKRVTKKVAKVAVAPARGAFLTLVRLNIMKLATKLVRVWNQPGGKEQLTKFWQGFGGDINKLKQTIIKGSKQQISGANIGVATEAIIAAASPILIALIPLIAHFKAHGSKKEQKEFSEGVQQGKQTLATDDDTPKSEVSMPVNKEVGIVADSNGDSVHDESVTTSEEESGGHDGETPPEDNTEDGAEANGTQKKKKAAEKAMASNFSPLGMFFMLLLYTMFAAKDYPVAVGLIQTYCIIAIICIPIAVNNQKNNLQRVAYLISFWPFNLFNHFTKKQSSE